MLVSITDTDLITKAQDDGDDIVFTLENGTVLAHEIESFTSGTGVLVAWVKIPELDSDEDSYLYMYYGNATADNQQNAEKVWDEDFVGVWHMDNDGAADTDDSTNFYNDGSTTGATSNASSKVGKGLSFDGNDYITITDDESLSMGATTDFTISFWISSSSSSQTSLIMNGSDGTGGKRYYIQLETDLFGEIDDNSVKTDIPGVLDINDGGWYYVVLTIDRGGNGQFYVNSSTDGSAVALSSTTGSIDDPDNPLVFGKDADSNDRYLTGSMDEIRISKNLKSAAWIATEYSNQNAPGTFLSMASEEVGPGPVGYWAFDEGYGTTANDSSGQSNSGTITGATWQDESQCVAGKCLYFDGTDDNMSIADGLLTDNFPSKEDGNSSFSTSFWVKPIVMGNWDMFLSKQDDSDRGWAIFTSANKNIYFQMGTGATTYQNAYTANGVLELNKWHYISSVFDTDANTMSIYVDSILASNGSENPKSYTGTVRGTAENFVIGEYGDGTEDFHGFIDEAKIYPYARSAEEINADYAAGLAGKGSSHGLTASFGDESDKWMSDGLVGYWKMDEQTGTTYEDSSGNNNTGTLTNAQETGTAEVASTTTTVVDADNANMSTTDNAYNGMIVEITGGTCGITVDTTRTISDYTGATKTITVPTAFSAETDACTFLIDHQIGGKFGNNVAFDGDDDYLDPSMDSDEANNLTFSFWFNSDDAGSIGDSNVSQRIVTQMSDSSNTRIAFGLNSDKIAVIWRWGADPNYATVEGITTLVADTWYHAVLTFDGTDYAMYLNGEEESRFDGTGTVDPTSDYFYIGKYPTSRWFDGTLDDVRIYNRALSKREVKKLSEWAPGPVAHWKFDTVDFSVDKSNRVLDEKLEGTGYEESGWSEDVGAGCTVDEDAAAADVNTPAGWGDQSLKIIKAASQNARTGKSSLGLTDSWTRVEVVITAETLANSTSLILLQALDEIDSEELYYLHLQQSSGGLFWFRANVYLDGSTITDYYASDTPLSLNTSYRVEFKWDVANDAFEWKIDGVTQDSAGLTADHGTHLTTLRVGSPDWDSAYAYTAYFDQIAVDGSGWIGEEKYGVYDQSTGENHGDLYGGPVRAIGKYGSALDFNYLNPDYVLVADDEKLRMNSNMTVEAWVKREGKFGEWNTVLDKGATYWEYWLGFNTSNNLVFMYNPEDEDDADRDYFLSTTAVTDSNWHHIAASYDGADVKVYLDGVVDYSEADTRTMWSSTGSMRIGVDNSVVSAVAMEGLIDDVRIYNYARTQDQIIEDMNAGHPAGGSPVGSPVAYWKFNHGYGDTAYDEMGNNNGTLDAGAGGTNLTETAMWDLDGKFGKAIEFDGTDDQVATPSQNFSNSSGLTFSAWAKRDTDTNEWMGIVNKWNDVATERSVGLFVGNSGEWAFHMSTDGGTNYNVVSDMQATNDGWHHILGTWDGTNMLLYIDGESQQDTETCSDILQSSQEIYIGRFTSELYEFDGLIDEVKIYNYAMTADQVATEYNSGSSVVMGRDASRDNDGTTVTGAAAEYCVPGDTAQCDGPVLEMDFNEKTGTTTYDRSGNGNDGTLGGDGVGTDLPSWARGKDSSGLDFDGVDDYVTTQTATGMDNTKGTVTAWVRPVSSPSLEAVIFNHVACANGRIILTQISDNRYAIHLGDSTTHFSGSSFTLGSWSHVALVWNGANYTTYFNGSEGNSGTGVEPACLDSTLEISDNIYFFDGKIDDVRIYNYARTPAQIAWDYNRGAPIGHWKMDETSGTQVHDWSGNSNAGTMTNMDPATDRVAGKFNNALDFDGDNDYVTVNGIASEWNGELGSISLWFAADSTDVWSDSNEYTLIKMRADGDNNYAILKDDSYSIHAQLATSGSDAELIKIDSSFGTAWHHVIVTWDDVATSSTMYIDGKLAGSDNIGTWVGAVTTAHIGAAHDPDRHWEGKIDDVRIYNYALTEAQIKEAYNNGAVSFR